MQFSLAYSVRLHLNKLGIIGVIILAFLVAFLYTPVLYQEPVFEPPYLAIVLQFIFVLGTSIAIIYVSAKSYLRSGSLTILLIGCAILVSSLASTVSVWTLSPYIAPILTANEAVTIGNIGLLISSFGLFLSALFTWIKMPPSKIGYRKIFLTTAFFVSILLVAIISITSDFALLPVFLTSSGPTFLRIVVLSLSASFYFASLLLLAWKYERSKSNTIFWYCLALSLICIALVASLLTMHLGSPMNWVSRIALYLSGIYFLIALFNPEIKRTNEDASGRWIEAFSTDREQIVSFFSKLSEGFVYGKAIEVSGKKDFVFLDVNQAYAKIVSKKQADIIGKSYRQVFPNISDDPEFEEMLSLYYKVAATGESSRFERYSKYTDKWVDVLVYSQKKDYFIVLFQDITERKKAEEKLKQYQHNLEKLIDERTKQLKDAERLAAIGATAGMVGHDIRNPLQAITSDVYLVKTELEAVPDSEEKKNALESLDEIEKNIDYINKIVQDLQDYARPLNPRDGQSSLEQIIDKLFVTDVSAQNIKVSVKVEEDAKTINADSYYITRVMYNLVTNAIQAMPKGGKLSIHAYIEENDAVITVTDTGVGIPKDIQNKMFTAMFTTKAKGQGFGLPVVKRMTESLGGTVTFESQEGKGTTFTIRLPQPMKKTEKTS